MSRIFYCVIAKLMFIWEQLSHHQNLQRSSFEFMFYRLKLSEHVGMKELQNHTFGSNLEYFR